jgi:hypothetical protein
MCGGWLRSVMACGGKAGAATPLSGRRTVSDLEKDFRAGESGVALGRTISVRTLKRRERRAPLTDCAVRNYFNFSTTSISQRGKVIFSDSP